MEANRESKSLTEAGAQSCIDFVARLRRSGGYQRLKAEVPTETEFLEELETHCWRCYSYAVRVELKGARAARLLEQLTNFEQALGDPCWLPVEVTLGLDQLRQMLEKLAARKTRGRPRDSVARLFRRTAPFFLPRYGRPPSYKGRVKQEVADEILNDLAATTFRKRVSPASYRRMSRRELAAERRATAAMFASEGAAK